MSQSTQPIYFPHNTRAARLGASTGLIDPGLAAEHPPSGMTSAKTRGRNEGEKGDTVNTYDRWREAVLDGTVRHGAGGILIDGYPLGLIAEQAARVGKGAPGRAALDLMDLYSEARRKHSDEHSFRYGKPVARRLTDSSFDAEHGRGAAARAHKTSDEHHRRLHHARLSIIEDAIDSKSRITVNGVEFFRERGRWVTHEPSAPRSLLSRAARMATGTPPSRDLKPPLYPATAQGLMKLGEETEPEFLAMVISKTKERKEAKTAAKETGAKSPRALARPSEREADEARRRIARARGRAQ